jgi:hypothetical protein
VGEKQEGVYGLLLRVERGGKDGTCHTSAPHYILHNATLILKGYAPAIAGIWGRKGGG